MSPKNHMTNPRSRRQMRDRSQILDRAERQAARRNGGKKMAITKTEDATGKALVAELEEAGADPNVVRMVRYGLGVIAQNIRAQAEQPHHLNAIGAAAIVDPGLAT